MIPVLDIGGTHATAARVDTGSWHVAGEHHRVDVDSHANAENILAAFAAAGAELESVADEVWGVAMPDPFDYTRGIGRFHGVAKFESLDGVDVRSGLLQRLPGPPRELIFCNDADAFTVGEWVSGAAVGSTRAVGLTLGTGVGSGWVDSGHVVDPGLPPGGRAHLLHVDGVPLEDAMSRRAIRRAYASATGDDEADVSTIAERARAGEHAASDALARALRSLGRALAPALRDFGAEVIVVGGSMSRSWELFEPWFREGAGDIPVAPIRVAADPDGAPLVGAGYVASGR